MVFRRTPPSDEYATTNDPAVAAGVVLVNWKAPLTADWDAGSFEIRAETFHSDVW